MWFKSAGVYAHSKWHEGEESSIRLEKSSRWNYATRTYDEVDIEVLTAECGYSVHGVGYKNEGKLNRREKIRDTQSNICSYCKLRVMKRMGKASVMI